MQNNLYEKTPMHVKLAYGSIEFSNTLGLVLFTSFGMYYLTDIVGISPAIAGTVTALGSLINAVAGPLFGMASDGCKSKYGRRRPFIVAVSIPLGIIIWLMFTDFGFSATGNAAYFGIMIALFYILLCGLDVPYTSLGAEITKDYDERSSLNFWRSLFCQISSIISGALPISIAAFLGSVFNDDGKGWSVMALIFGIISTLVIVLGWRFTRGQEKHREDNEPLRLRDFADAFRNKAFVSIILVYAAGIGAYAVGLTMNVYFLMNCIGLSEAKISIVLIIYNVAAVAWLPLIPLVSKKFSKQTAWVVFMGIWGLTLLGMYFFADLGDELLIYVLTAIGGSGSMVGYTVGWAMLPDCIEVDEFKTGKRREGIYYGILTIVQKGSQALIIFLCGILMEMVHYDETLVTQSAATLDGIRSIYAFGTCAFIVLSFIFIAKYPINRENHAKLLKAIEQKNAGQKPDLAGIENLVK